jgi:rhodanese-related sulfurtransferase
MNDQLRYYENKLAFEIGSWDLKAAMQSRERVFVIDARSSEAFQKEHIPGAINIPHRNQKFTPQLLENEEGIHNLGHLVRSYFKMAGHHIQFNVVTAETLRDAQKHPEKYRDLIVRVAGYSDYFLDCSVELQNEIIKRTEHLGF